jgi:glutamate transport system permease protein
VHGSAVTAPAMAPVIAQVNTISDYWDLFIEGFWVTVQLTALSFTFAMVIGVVVASLRVSPVPPLRAVGTVYVETLRNIPLLLILLFLVFAVPKLGALIDYFPAAVIGLSLYTGAFVAEAIRSGINAVGVGQAEAARSIGLTFPQSLQLVILPQALRNVVAPLANVFIALTKNTSLASAISVVELTSVLGQVIERTGQAIEALAVVSLLYMVITIPAGLLAGFVERRVRIVR